MKDYTNLTNTEYEALSAEEKSIAAPQLIKARSLEYGETMKDVPVIFENEWGVFLKSQMHKLIIRGWNLRQPVSLTESQPACCERSQNGFSCKNMVKVVSTTTKAYFSRPVTFYGLSWHCKQCRQDEFSKAVAWKKELDQDLERKIEASKTKTRKDKPVTSAEAIKLFS